ncbi:MAG: hypothetical protein CSA55_04155 [Ilumatobacter coccineus]|uniref:Uncharacterized protein n=1 Tax=Ilumatobacter coccineus TaxID=467094 RepID=A0A2G6K8S7_9ACTN|nr:MAG: hypothetical protein CSA55_04155 [Ilumatobacter coccineus]
MTDLAAARSDRRLAVRVSRDAQRQIRGGSPWLYDGSIRSVSHDGKIGDLAVIFDDRRRFVAIGLWDPSSPIRVKILHQGKPTPIDGAFWRERCRVAADRRASLIESSSTDAYRWVHGENDGLPGLVVDRYRDTLVIKIYSAAWGPYLLDLIEALQDTAVEPVSRVVFRSARSVSIGIDDGTTLVGTPPDGPIRFVERGLEMEADVVRGQKTGHFLDQRDNRAMVRSMSSGRRVLDVFASTGGFALSAAAGGARSVHLVDQSAPALATAQRNFDANRAIAEVNQCAVEMTVGDAFDVLERLNSVGESYDLVIVDPPSFASNRATIGRALAAYGRLTRLALGVLEPGGRLVQASCSSRVGTDEFVSTVMRSASSTGRRLVEFRRTGHGVDHPIGFEHGAYLDCIVLDDLG